MTSTASPRHLWAMPRFGLLVPGLLLAVVLGGCRSCTGGSGGKLDAEKAVTADKEKKVRSTARPARDAVGGNGPIRSLAMRVPQVDEPVREVSESVQKARALIEEGAAGAATEARGILSQWLVDHPTDADAHYWMGRSWMAERIKVQAVAPYEKALEHAPDFTSAHRWLAFVLHAENRCAEAVPHLDAALTALPEDPTVHIDRAVCAVQLQEWDLLAERLQSACDLGDAEVCETAALAARMAERRKNLTKLKEERSKAKSWKGGKARGGKAKIGGGRGKARSLLKSGKFGGGPRGAERQPPPADEGTTTDGTTTDGTTEE